MNYKKTECCENCINQLRCGMARERDYKKSCWGYDDVDSGADHMAFLYAYAPYGCVCITIDDHGHVEFWNKTDIVYDPIAGLWARAVGDMFIGSSLQTDIFVDPNTAKRDLINGKWIKGVSA